jgi:uncharacterized protein YcfL
MKISVIAVFALLLIGCESSRQSASLTPEQAKAMAIRLANDKAATLYHSQPFQDGQPARLVAGRWVWTDTRGFGLADIQATVELAADGSTNHVDLQLLSSQNRGASGRGGF